MMETVSSTHKSIMLAIRQAANLYLFEKGRENDIPKVIDNFLPLDNYQGNRVPVVDVVKEVYILSDVLQDNYLGLKLNMLVDIESLPFYKAVSDCIRPFNETMNKLPFLLVCRIVRFFFFLITQSISVVITAEKESIRFDFISSVTERMSKNQIDGAMILIYRVMEAFHPDILKKVYISHRNTPYEKECYLSTFRVPIEFSDTTSLVYDLQCKNHYKNAAGLLVKSEEDVGKRFFINSLFNIVSAEFPEMSYEARCEMIIDTMMGVSLPTRSYVAQSMNISVSTLKRKLYEENTSFQEILDKVRKRLVEKYLKEKQLSTTDIAYLLGYKSHSQFFKAFKLWFGMTPKSYQKFISKHK